jgi:hypothetical protein
MAARLLAWLHEEVKTQLDLGNCWLQDKNEHKARLARPSVRVDKKWDGLYRDNGSCIDIIGPIAPDHQNLLLVLKVRYRRAPFSALR